MGHLTFQGCDAGVTLGQLVAQVGGGLVALALGLAMLLLRKLDLAHDLVCLIFLHRGHGLVYGSHAHRMAPGPREPAQHHDDGEHFKRRPHALALDG